jgi:hypothetical protein
MPSFAQEIRTIRTLLAGSYWATDREVQIVLGEYDRFLEARRVRNRERLTSLQIFFASRAIDSLLAHIVQWEKSRRGLGGNQRSIWAYIDFIQRNRINGNRFSTPTKDSLQNDLKDLRNRFLHQAGEFPTDTELQDFLSYTLLGIQEIITWR